MESSQIKKEEKTDIGVLSLSVCFGSQATLCAYTRTLIQSLTHIHIRIFLLSPWPTHRSILPTDAWLVLQSFCGLRLSFFKFHNFCLNTSINISLTRIIFLSLNINSLTLKTRENYTFLSIEFTNLCLHKFVGIR